MKYGMSACITLEPCIFLLAANMRWNVFESELSKSHFQLSEYLELSQKLSDT